jgi:hypothetical protein
VGQSEPFVVANADAIDPQDDEPSLERSAIALRGRPKERSDGRTVPIHGEDFGAGQQTVESTLRARRALSIVVIARIGRAHQRAQQIGAADDADYLSLAHDRHPFDFFQIEQRGDF